MDMTDGEPVATAVHGGGRSFGRMIRLFAGSAGVRLIGMVFSFTLGIQLARHLGVENYGVYGVAMSVVSVMSIVGEFGLPQLVIREAAAAHARGNWERFISVVVWARERAVLLSSGTLVCAAVVLFSGVSQGPLRNTLIVGSFLVPLVAIGKIDGAALRGMQRVVLGQLPEVVARPAIFSVLLAVSVMFGRQLTAPVAIGFGVAAAGGALFLARGLLVRMVPSGSESVRISADDSLRGAVLPMAMVEGARILHGHLITLMMGAIAVAAQVGVFRAAASMALVLSVPVTVVTVVASPIMSGLYSKGEMAELKRVLAASAVAMTAGGGLLMLPFALVGEEVLILLLGEGYGGAKWPLLILAGGSVVASLFGLGAALLTMTGQERRVLIGMCASLGVMVAVAPLMIARQGAIGAALASSLALVLWSFLMWVEARRRLGVDCSVLSVFARLRAGE